MTSTKPAGGDSAPHAFFVERYLSPAAAKDLSAASARLSRLCIDADETGNGVRYLYSAYLSSEDTCFCLFRAPSSDAIRTANELAQFPLDRITDAALLICADRTPR